MARFNHMFDVAFSLDSNTPDASDVTPDMLRAALMDRINNMCGGDWSEACGLCDSYEYDAEGQSTGWSPANPER